MKSSNLIFPTILILFTSTYIPKAEAKNSLNTQINPNKLISLALTDNKSTLIALNGYWGPDSDFHIQMPGLVEVNKPRELISWSNTSQTVYMIAHRDMPVETPYLSTEVVREMLQSSMRERMTSEGRILTSSNLKIDEHSGLELLIQHNDGKTGKYQAFIVKGRMYLLGALTQGELTSESVNFFDSFRVYPTRVR